MKLLKHLTLLILLTGTTTHAQSHGHINAGAEDTNGSGMINSGDKLKMYFEPGTQTTSLAFNNGANTYGADGFHWNGFTTFTSLHQSSYAAEAPNYNSVGALSGSFLQLQLVSISGPAGGTFSFYDASGTDPLWAYTIGAGFTFGTGAIALTESAWFASDPSDPYGHIHGRMFAVDTAGLYTATWQLIDTQSLLTTSDQFFTYYDALAVPEPQMGLLLGGTVMLLGCAAQRRRQNAP